jgi:cytochrome c-type biogenesis protein CcmH/NrfG
VKNFILIIVVISVITGCQQQEEQKPQYRFPTGPIQSQDDVELLRKAVREDPSNPNAWIKLGNILMDTTRYSEAIEAYQSALEIDPYNVDVRVDMGTCYRRSGMSDRAVEEFRKALTVNPDHLFGHMNLGVVLAYDFGKYDEAIGEFERYLELAPNAPNAEKVRQEIERLRFIK